MNHHETSWNLIEASFIVDDLRYLQFVAEQKHERGITHRNVVIEPTNMVSGSWRLAKGSFVDVLRNEFCKFERGENCKSTQNPFGSLRYYCNYQNLYQHFYQMSTTCFPWKYLPRWQRLDVRSFVANIKFQSQHFSLYLTDLCSLTAAHPEASQTQFLKAAWQRNTLQALV